MGSFSRFWRLEAAFGYRKTRVTGSGRRPTHIVLEARFRRRKRASKLDSARLWTTNSICFNGLLWSDPALRPTPLCTSDQVLHSPVESATCWQSLLQPSKAKQDIDVAMAGAHEGARPATVDRMGRNQAFRTSFTTTSTSTAPITAVSSALTMPVPMEIPSA